jgi:hypothetical protein
MSMPEQDPIEVEPPQPLTSADLAGVDVACPVCSYNLRDGMGGRCPECGEALTYDDLFPPVHDLSLFPAFDTKRPVPARRRVPLGIMTGTAFMLAGALMVPAFMLASLDWRCKALGGVVLAIGVGVFVPVLSVSRGRGRWTLIVGGAILVAMYVVIALGVL